LLKEILLSTKNKLKIAWIWLKKNYVIVLLSLGILLLVIGFLFCKSSIEEKLVLKKLDLTRQKIAAARLTGQKDILKQNRGANEKEISEIEDILRSVDADIAHKKAEIGNLTLKQKMEKFNDLGY
jgi:hypothetical protein